jgi:Uma2 family endonuclease
MSTLIDRTAAPASLEVPGPVMRVPSLDELERLTAVPDRRVVYRGVGWSFYEELVDSIPESTSIHVDYDGKDLEVMAKGRIHEGYNRLLGVFVTIVTVELEIPCKGLRETTWKRPEIARGLEADECYYFQPDKLAAAAEAWSRGSRDIADIPNPDLAIEVDISPPQVDRAGIYAALGVTEVWRFVDNVLVIERLTPRGIYAPVETSGFLPVTAEDVRRWVLDEDSSDESAWARRLQAELRRMSVVRGQLSVAKTPSGPPEPAIQPTMEGGGA